MRCGVLQAWFVLCETVSVANKDLSSQTTSQVSAFMVDMVCRYTMVAVSQQAGTVITYRAGRIQTPKCPGI